MRKLSVLLMCLLSGGLVVLDAWAQEPTAGVIFFQLREFNIPFKNDPNNLNVTQVRLYVSTDQGRHWQMTSTAAPDGKQFRFSTPQDGYFWFAVQTVYKDGKQFPPSLDELRPDLKVIVDTQAPVVQVQALPPRPGEVGVSWSVRDDNLDLALPDSVRVEYRLIGGANWIPLTIPLGGNQVYWNPGNNAQIEVRVVARDRAGNIGQDKTTVSLGGGGGQLFNNPIGNASQPDAYKELDRKFVNSKQVSLSYDLKDVGPSGVSAVELWYTLHKARAWNKLTEYPLELKSPLEANQTKKLTFEVNDEGIYGITLVAKSGVGLGERAPQPGERPQFWIEVDLTKPVVQILDVQVGNGIDKGKLTTAWSARDKNLGSQPIRLSYAEQKDGPWNTLADKLPNNGKHTWKMPEGVPYQFFLRVEAIDLAGNIGEATTQDRIKVDLSLPKAQIRAIEPGGR
jgi:hypothetical protein